MPRPGVLDAQIKFRLGDRKLTLDYAKVPFSAWPELKQAVGFTQVTLARAIADGDIEAVVALIWLERKQRERRLRYHQVFRELETADEDSDFRIINLIIDGESYGGDDDEDGIPEQDDEDPTGGGTS